MMKCETVYQEVWTLLQVTVHVKNAHIHILKCIYQSTLPLNAPYCLMWITGQVLSSVTVEEKNCENHFSDCGDFPKQSRPWHVWHVNSSTLFLDLMSSLHLGSHSTMFFQMTSRGKKNMGEVTLLHACLCLAWVLVTITATLTSLHNFKLNHLFRFVHTPKYCINIVLSWSFQWLYLQNNISTPSATTCTQSLLLLAPILLRQRHSLCQSTILCTL